MVKDGCKVVANNCKFLWVNTRWPREEEATRRHAFWKIAS